MERGIRRFHRGAVNNVAMPEYAMSLKFDVQHQNERKKQEKHTKMHVKMMFNNNNKRKENTAWY